VRKGVEGSALQAAWEGKEPMRRRKRGNPTTRLGDAGLGVGGPGEALGASPDLALFVGEKEKASVTVVVELRRRARGKRTKKR
jgi:hypothetical protein